MSELLTKKDATSADGESDSVQMEEKTYASTLAKVAHKEFPFLVMDFECLEHPDDALTPDPLAIFLLDRIGLKKAELTELLGLAAGMRTLRVKTSTSVIVSERFGHNVEFNHTYNGRRWKCVIRGGLSLQS